LQDSNGQPLFDHHIKARLLWEAYKERLGTLDSPAMFFDLDNLLNASQELGCLFEPFSSEEIDKSPVPDGFNTDFLKKCWPIIKHDFYALCIAFHQGNLCLQSLNGSYITLIPKVDGPTKVSDFRPISLWNTSIKIITKLLANRL
jgi:hypothetical protein